MLGLTLIAILTAALLLPGMIAARAFYQASRTLEVEPSIPALSSVDGIALIGLFSVVVHLLFVASLGVVETLPPLVPFPSANPYILFTSEAARLSGLGAAFRLFFGLAWLCATAMATGFVSGKLLMRAGDKSIFYGAMADVIAAGEGDNRFITADVLTKVRHEGRSVGYKGTVISMIRDADRFPAKILLKDASLFYLDISGRQPVRREHPDLIDWVSLTNDGWESVSFQIFEVVEGSLPST